MCDPDNYLTTTLQNPLVAERDYWRNLTGRSAEPGQLHPHLPVANTTEYTEMDCSVLGAVEGNTEYVYCCGAVTEVLKVGTSVKQYQGSSQKTPPDLLFLVIPGNPGVVGFYKTFMQTLHLKFGRCYPVWAVSHAGHCVPPDTMDMTEGPAETSVNDVFGLNGQIEHKLAFLREHVPRDTKLVLIGHSIGCYIILDMMKSDPELQVLKAVLLFPTIERMAQTPQGRLMTPVLCHLRYFTYLPIFLLSLLPETLKTAIVKLVFRGLRSLDHTVIPATVSLISVDCAANAMYMGGQEMRKVLARDNFTINENLNKLVFYYGASDLWCPVQYYQDMKRDFPHGDIKLCENGIRHAFVLDAGKEVASLIFEWIQRDVQTSCKLFTT